MFEDFVKFLGEPRHFAILNVSVRTQFCYVMFVQCDFLLRYAKEHTTDKVRVLTLEQNRGKGGAVRMGVLSCRGRRVLMADADGATKFSDVTRLDDKLNSLPDKKGVAIGSRAHLVSLFSRSTTTYHLFFLPQRHQLEPKIFL